MGHGGNNLGSRVAPGARITTTPTAPRTSTTTTTTTTTKKSATANQTNKTPANLFEVPNNARTTSNVNEVFRRLELYHGIPRNVASNRLHVIKEMAHRGPADNVVFDMTGNVFDPITGDWLGTLTE